MAHCSMLPPGLSGVLCMMASGITMNTLLVIQQLMRQWGWSEFAMLTFSCALGLIGLLLWMPVSPTPAPAKGDVKWILCVGFFAAGSTILMIFSVRVGMPLGDFAALNSTNVVFAAFLGRVFLREALRWLHCAAVVLSIAGALLISRPRVIFGSEGGADESSEVVWMGYLFALMSGFCDACIYISSRKAGHVPAMFIITAILAQFGLANVACGFIFDAWDFRPWVDSPADAVGVFAGLFAAGALTTVLFIYAAQMCPAAVSATVDTATRMVSGYAAQVLLFGAAIGPLTIVGSLLMFGGVVSVGLLQASQSGGAEDEDASPPTGDADQASESDTFSLASFAASEFAGPSLRLRRPTSSQPQAQVVGVAFTISVLPTMVSS